LASAHYGKAIVYEKMGDIENSITSLTNANLFAANNLDYRFELGRLYFNKGVSNLSLTQDKATQIVENESAPNKDGVIEDLQIQKNVTPNKVKKNDDLARAEQIFLSILSSNNNHANALYSLAILYQKVGDTDKASQSVQKLLSVLSEGPTKDAVRKQFKGLY